MRDFTNKVTESSLSSNTVRTPICPTKSSLEYSLWSIFIDLAQVSSQVSQWTGLNNIRIWFVYFIRKIINFWIDTANI